MIELVAGKHEPHHAAMEDKDGEGKCGTWPTRALEGTVFDLHGEPGRLITFCGDRERTVIDGIGNRRGGAGIQIVRSTYVRFAGFTIRNLLRAVDIQDSSHAEVTHVTSENTWHEGYRIRYNSTYNLIQHCHIKDTGKGYVGNGEGIYVGTARGRTTDCGNPEDNSDYNVLSNNVFGPNVPSENIDVKEYTTGGVIRGNVFNGTPRGSPQVAPREEPPASVGGRRDHRPSPTLASVHSKSPPPYSTCRFSTYPTTRSGLSHFVPTVFVSTAIHHPPNAFKNNNNTPRSADQHNTR